MLRQQCIRQLSIMASQSLGSSNNAGVTPATPEKDFPQFQLVALRLAERIRIA